MLRPGRVYMLTLTAPGSAEHSPDGGRRLCECTTTERLPNGTPRMLNDEVALAEWNGLVGRNWNNFVTDLRRMLGVPVEYSAAKEIQARGALHLHVPIRFGGWSERLNRRDRSGCPFLIKKLAMRHGFGHSVDLREVAGDDIERVSWYPAKYVSKAAAARDDAPYMHPVTGELGRGRWRTWTASRNWGDTMAAIRAAQRAWAQEAAAAAAGRGSARDERAPGGGAAAALDPNTASYADGAPVVVIGPAVVWGVVL